MDAKLASYRSTKRRQALLNSFKDRLYNMVSFQQVKVDGEKSTHVIVEADVDPHPKKQDKITPVHKPQHKPRTHSETESILSVASSSSADQHPEDLPASTTPKPPRSYLYYVTYLVYFLFWVTLYAIAIELRFGVVFLMLSALVVHLREHANQPQGRRRDLGVQRVQRGLQGDRRDVEGGAV
ncbi:hypothetical protein quinque_012234 [Culex quinquefasciatus]